MYILLYSYSIIIQSLNVLEAPTINYWIEMACNQNSKNYFQAVLRCCSQLKFLGSLCSHISNPCLSIQRECEATFFFFDSCWALSFWLLFFTVIQQLFLEDLHLQWCQDMQTPPWLPRIFSVQHIFRPTIKAQTWSWPQSCAMAWGKHNWSEQSYVVQPVHTSILKSEFHSSWVLAALTCLLHRQNKLSPKPLQIHHSAIQLLQCSSVLPVCPVSFRENTRILYGCPGVFKFRWNGGRHA